MIRRSARVSTPRQPGRAERHGYAEAVRALSRLNRPVVAIAAVTLLAGWLRFVHVSHPSDYVFDEVYYPKAACILVGWSNETCTIDSSDEQYWRQQKWDVGSWVHPPLGKWEIAMGIKAFGMRRIRLADLLGGRRHRSSSRSRRSWRSCCSARPCGPRSPGC